MTLSRRTMLAGASPIALGALFGRKPWRYVERIATPRHVLARLAEEAFAGAHRIGLAIQRIRRLDDGALLVMGEPLPPIRFAHVCDPESWGV